MGFAFFDRARPKHLPFSYVITTGNEACIESLDYVEYLIDTDQADVFLLFMEDVKTPSKLSCSRKALVAGKPIIVTKIGRSDAELAQLLSYCLISRLLYRLQNCFDEWYYRGRRH